ncbi:hypothetical protein WNZ14_22120 [Hoeflea sp. AS60]|uniref:hypothetical protein n=1 Tax=Hoeflea sp. AS60 TaxID=3135780 RepID=UPI00317FF82C
MKVRKIDHRGRTGFYSHVFLSYVADLSLSHIRDIIDGGRISDEIDCWIGQELENDVRIGAPLNLLATIAKDIVAIATRHTDGWAPEDFKAYPKFVDVPF